MFSICIAMALASNMPTQIGSTFCPSLSRRITIGMLVMGSTISPLMRHLDLHGPSPLPSLHRLTLGASTDAVKFERVAGVRLPANARPQTLCGPARSTCTATVWPIQELGPGRFTTTLPARPAGQLGVAPPARRIDEHVHLASDHSLVQPRLNVPLQRLERDDAPRLLVVADVVRQTACRRACSAAANT